MLAPPWISVPPSGYGSVESVVGVLTDALVRRGHAVTLFCAPGSRSSARVVPLLEEAHPEEIERSLYEVDHVEWAFEEIDLAVYDRRFDVVHGPGAHLQSEPQRSRCAAATPRSQRERDPPRGWAAVVHGAVRPRQPDHELPGAAIPTPAGSNDLARACRPPGRGARRLPRTGAGQDPARAALRRAHRAR
jgi:hypothetical protein